jgi:hypothetical protein
MLLFFFTAKGCYDHRFGEYLLLEPVEHPLQLDQGSFCPQTVMIRAKVVNFLLQLKDVTTIVLENIYFWNRLNSPSNWTTLIYLRAKENQVNSYKSINQIKFNYQ